MAVSKEEVKYIAKLARLNFREDELEEFTKQFNGILSYMDTLNEVNTDDIEPLSHPVEGANVMRPDVQVKGSDIENALKNAPETDGTFFLVPKIINPDSH
jgi:aspartyl-tRNA(Asn)/glutamyl-tRNA(Gln) amidotransferase subunit C